MTVKKLHIQPSHTRINLNYPKIQGLSEEVKRAYEQAELPPAVELPEIETYLREYWHVMQQNNDETEILWPQNTDIEPVVGVYTLGITPFNAYEMLAWWEANIYCEMCYRAGEGEHDLPLLLELENWAAIERGLAYSSGNIMMIALQSKDGRHLSTIVEGLWMPMTLRMMLMFYFQGLKPSLDSFEGERYAYFLNEAGYFAER